MKQRKIVIVGLLSMTMMLTMFSTSNHPQKTEAMESSNETNSYRLYMYGYDEKLALEYEDIKIEEEIAAKEESVLYNMPDDVANNGELVYNNGEEPTVKKESTAKTKKKKENTYTEEDLMLLAGAIENEGGSDFITNTHQRAIASVIINRTKSDYYDGDTIREIIYQKNQYDIRDKFNHPSNRAIKNAKYVLENGSTLPSNCIFQSEFIQGSGVYTTFKTPISTTYICYKN